MKLKICDYINIYNKLEEEKKDRIHLLVVQLKDSPDGIIITPDPKYLSNKK